MTAVRKSRKTSYHHGRLREALLEAALALVEEQGASAVSLREVARRAGVSHAAPAHHFGDKAGMLTALAVQGFALFTEALRAATASSEVDPARRFALTGLAYVMFAAEHRAYFEVMFSPELYRREDPELIQTATGAYAVLLEMARASFGREPTEEELTIRAITAWAQAHGLATLWLDGNLSQYTRLDAYEALARKVFFDPTLLKAAHRVCEDP
jgi:AcrR family transcriptional regulator